MGLSHDGFKFLEGKFEGLKGYAVGRMTKSRCGQLYIDDAGLGPDAGSIEYGYRVPFGGIHVFIGKISEPGTEPDICTDLVETAQRASPARIQPAMKRAFIGCIHGIESEPVSEDETVIYSNGESSTGETESLYQVQDGLFGGFSDGSSILDSFEPPNRVTIFMAGTQPVLQNSTAAAMNSGSVAGAGGPRRPAQVLSGLLDAWTMLLTMTVTPETQDRHNAEVTKLRDQITQAKEDLAAEETGMAEERAALDAQSQRIHAKNYRLLLDQNASNDVLRRRHQSRLPTDYNAMNLFSTPGAGTSNLAAVNRTAAPRTGTPDQPQVMVPPRRTDNSPQYTTPPLGHFSTPLDNMITSASRLAAITMEGESPAAVETRRARDLLQTAMVQQHAYSYSRDKIHSTPHPSKSYSRHMDEPVVSSSARNRDAPRGPNPVRGGANAQDLVDNGRARREAALAAQYAGHHQPAPV